MNYGVDNYERKQIFEGKKFDPVFVQDGQKKYELLNVEGNLNLLIRKDEVVKIVYRVPKKLLAPIKANVIVGSAKYYIGDMLYAEIPIFTTQDIAKIDYAFCLKEIFKMWCAQY
jgi:D-alanyl-D-alanine carboxypeptidase (penicillin-binding protein 5/6)